MTGLGWLSTLQLRVLIIAQVATQSWARFTRACFTRCSCVLYSPLAPVRLFPGMPKAQMALLWKGLVSMVVFKGTGWDSLWVDGLILLLFLLLKESLAM